MKHNYLLVAAPGDELPTGVAESRVAELPLPCVWVPKRASADDVVFGFAPKPKRADQVRGVAFKARRVAKVVGYEA